MHQKLVAVPVKDGDGADDRQEVEDEVERLRQRRVERDEVQRLSLGLTVSKDKDLPTGNDIFVVPACH